LLEFKKIIILNSINKMLTIVCAILTLVLFVVFFYFRNSFNKEKENCSKKLIEKDNYENQQKISFEDKIEREKTLCKNEKQSLNNEKEVLTRKLNNIYTTIDTMLNNLSNSQRLTEEIENLRVLRAQAQAISSIIPSQASVDELRRKVQELDTNISSKINTKDNDTIDPVSQSMSNIVNTMLSIFIEEVCKNADSKVREYVGETSYDEKLKPEEISCYSNGEQCYGSIRDEVYDRDRTRGEYVYGTKTLNGEFIWGNLCKLESEQCVPRDDLIKEVRKANYRELDKTHFEFTISELKRMRDTFTQDQHKEVAENFLQLPSMMIEQGKMYGIENDAEIIAGYYINSFVEFSVAKRPVKLKYDALIKYFVDTKDKFCKPNVPKDYKVYVTNFVDNMYDSYGKIN
jgi:hypothetical protein